MITAIMLLALVQVPEVHQTEPPTVFRTTVNPRINAHCYNIPAPVGASAMYCDVKSPATGHDYAIVMVNPGGSAIIK